MSHVKLAISPARRPALAGDMASKPSGLHLEMVICQFESSQPSHPVGQKRESQRRPQKGPPFADYSTTTKSLQVPKLDKAPATSPEVSTNSLNYSRFPESPTGDYSDHECVPQMAVLVELAQNFRPTLTLPPAFIQRRLESGGCHHAQLEQRAKARNHQVVQRLGPVAVRIWRHMRQSRHGLDRG